MSGTHPSLNGSQEMQKRRLEILKTLTNQTLWKKKAAEEFEVSVQTVGRDVDALHKDGLLEYTLTEAEGPNRNHYVGYYTTDKGRTALENYSICKNCGDVIDPSKECPHEYHPFHNGGGK